MKLGKLLLIAVVPGLLMGRSAGAESVSEFFAGKTVTVAVGTTAVGSYDAYARLLARHFGNHVPGNPATTPRNMPGGGGDRKSTRLNSSHSQQSRMPSSA